MLSLFFGIKNTGDESNKFDNDETRFSREYFFKLVSNVVICFSNYLKSLIQSNDLSIVHEMKIIRGNTVKYKRHMRIKDIMRLGWITTILYIKITDFYELTLRQKCFHLYCFQWQKQSKLKKNNFYPYYFILFFWRRDFISVLNN